MRSLRLQHRRSFRSVRNVTWDEDDPPTVQGGADQNIASRAELMKQWRAYHPGAIDRSHLIAENNVPLIGTISY